MYNNILLKVSRGKNNQIDILVLKHTENLFEYEYIEIHNTIDGAMKYIVKNMAKIKKLPSEIKSTWMDRWYKVNYYNLGFFTRLAEYYKDSDNPFQNFINDIENINNSQNFTITVEKI